MDIIAVWLCKHKRAGRIIQDGKEGGQNGIKDEARQAKSNQSTDLKGLLQSLQKGL